jgi:hypothetical protein
MNLGQPTRGVGRVSAVIGFQSSRRTFEFEAKEENPATHEAKIATRLAKSPSTALQHMAVAGALRVPELGLPPQEGCGG